MITLTQSGSLMGVDVYFEFDIEITEPGRAPDPWGCDPGSAPEFIVNQILVYTEGGPATEVTGEWELSLIDRFERDLVENIQENEADEYYFGGYSD